MLVGRGRDITNESAARSALVLAPHPDDETIGCGAAIARKAAHGTRVHVVIATDEDGNASRRQAECTEACRRLGLAPGALQFLHFPDGSLHAQDEALDATLRTVIDHFRPDEVIAPAAVDAHLDHRALAAAVARLRAKELRGVPVLSYPVWFWNRWAWVDPSTPRGTQNAELIWRALAATFTLRPRFVRTGGFLAQKQHALAAHTSQNLDPEWLTLFFGAEELFFETPAPRP